MSSAHWPSAESIASPLLRAIVVHERDAQILQARKAWQIHVGVGLERIGPDLRQRGQSNQVLHVLRLECRVTQSETLELLEAVGRVAEGRQRGEVPPVPSLHIECAKSSNFTDERQLLVAEVGLNFQFREVGQACQRVKRQLVDLWQL